MLKFHAMYHPITSRPFLSHPRYQEYPPSRLVSPYVSCYWSSDGGRLEENKEVLIIPDTCMDIIVRFNHTKETISGYLCGIQDEPFRSVSEGCRDNVTTFAIRFHFWSAHLFMDLNFKESYGQNLPLETLGNEWRLLLNPYFHLLPIEEKIGRVEKLLMEKLTNANLNTGLFNSFQQIITGRGGMTIKDICEYSCVSQRQTERQFLQKVGLPIKRISNLVRYQCVWRDMVTQDQFDIHDAVYRYGYVDQSHLLKEFKRFHGMVPEEAKCMARDNR